MGADTFPENRHVIDSWATHHESKCSECNTATLPFRPLFRINENITETLIRALINTKGSKTRFLHVTESQSKIVSKMGSPFRGNNYTNIIESAPDDVLLVRDFWLKIWAHCRFFHWYFLLCKSIVSNLPFHNKKNFFSLDERFRKRFRLRPIITESVVFSSLSGSLERGNIYTKWAAKKY